jgi:ankyrin repeat protein
MRDITTVSIAFLAILCLATPSAFADGTYTTIFEGELVVIGIGTVVAMDAQSLSVSYKATGKTEKYMITQTTEICLNETPGSSWKDIRVGQGIVVVSDTNFQKAIIIRDGQVGGGAPLRCEARTAPVENLFDAAKAGNAVAVKRLISAGADINARNEAGWTPLHFAAAEGHNDIIDLLLNKGARIDAQDKDGITPLIKAIVMGKDDSVEHLLKRGAEVTSENSRAVYFAAYQQQPRIISMLIAKGADVNAKESDNSTPLIKAAEMGHTSVVRVLLAAQADVNAKALNGATALLIASQNGHLHVVQALLTAGAEINAVAEGNGATALIAASYGGHIEVVKTLLKAKADVNVKMGNGTTALALATKQGYSEVAQLLRNAGAKE